VADVGHALRGATRVHCCFRNAAPGAGHARFQRTGNPHGVYLVISFDQAGESIQGTNRSAQRFSQFLEPRLRESRQARPQIPAAMEAAFT
jgi:hypothetical protein